ncbi:MAG: WG repeat-containing protein [Cytophagales bacterium]|nr:WG repeat-containing protein [Cytophagales bacterium]
MKKIILLFFVVLHLCINGSAQISKNIMPVKTNYKWGFIDKSGKNIIDPVYDYCEPFSCGLSKVKLRGNYGVIDTTGKQLVAPIHSDIKILCPNYIAIRKDTLWGIDDKSGMNLVQVAYDKIDVLDNNTFMLKKGNKYGIYKHRINKTSEIIYNGVSVAGFGYYLVQKDNKLGLLDSTLNSALKTEYTLIDVLSPKAFLFKLKDLINVSAEGQITFNPDFIQYKKINEKCISIKSKKGGWSLYSITAKKIITKEEQESFTVLDNDLVMINKANKHGVLDYAGNEILPQKFSNIHLNEGLLLVEQTGKWGLADKQGKFLIETVHNKLFPFRKSIAVFETPTGKGLIDNAGKVLAQPTFTNIDLNNNIAKCTKPDGSISTLRLDNTGGAPAKGGKGKAKPAPKEIVVIDETAATHGHAWLKGPNKKWGLLGHDTLFVPYRFDEVIEVTPNLSIILSKIDYRTNQKMYGYINQNKLNDLATAKVGLVNKESGKMTAQPNYWYIRVEDYKTGNNAKVILEGGQQGLIDNTGKLFTEYIYTNKDKKKITEKINYVGKFNDGIARFCVGCNVNYMGAWDNSKVTGGKWGFITQDAQIAIEPQYDDVTDMLNSRAIVKLKNQYGVIANTGVIVLKISYENLSFVPESDNKLIKTETTKDRSGLINWEGKVLTSINYDKIYPYKEGMARVVVNGKYGFINENNAIAIEAKYDNLLDFSEGLAPFYQDKKWGYLDKQGKEVILANFPFAGDFKSGLSPVLIDGKIAYINKYEKIAIPAQYMAGSDFENGYAVVQEMQSKLIGVIDTTGSYVVDPKYGDIHFLMNYRFAKVKTDDGCKLFDLKTKKLVSKKSYPDINDFNYGLALVKKDEYYNYIDTTGKIVISKKYTNAGDFSDGLARVQFEGKYGYINTAGEKVHEFLYTNATDMIQNRAMIEGPTKLWGIIDKNGKHITFEKYITPKPFSYGYSLVNTPSKEYYFVDSLGNVAFKNQIYQEAYSFEKPGVARVKYQGKWGLVNTSGYQVADFKYDNISEFVNGQAVVTMGKSTGIFDLDGKVVAEPVYDAFTFTSGGLIMLEKWDMVGYLNADKTWLWELKK